MGKVVIMDHPLVAHKLTIMRDKNTSVKDFRELVSEIGMLITYEATRDLPMTTKHIETPICEMDAPHSGWPQVRSRPHSPGRSGSGGRRAANGSRRPCGPYRYVPGRGDSGAPSLFLQNAQGRCRARRADRGPHAGYWRFCRRGHRRNEEAGLQAHQAHGPRGRSRGHQVPAGEAPPTWISMPVLWTIT